jgi:DNA polymerase IV
MGLGLGRVTVRFETKDTPPGPVWTFASDDPALHRLSASAVVRPDAGSVRVALRLGLPGV